MPEFPFVTVAKVGVFCDAVTHSTEKRKDGEVKVVQVSARIQPFDVKLATAVDTRMRQTLFRMNDAEPQPHIRKVDFVLAQLTRQLIQVFSTPDTVKASIAFDQVRVTNVAARTGSFNGYALTCKLIFGPASARELEYVEDWRNGQRFLTFAAAEPNADLELEAAPADDDDGVDPNQIKLPEPEFETDGAGKPLEAGAPPAAAAEPDRANRPLHVHKGSKTKH